MKSITYFFVLCLALAACSENKTDQDHNVITVADTLVQDTAPKVPPHQYDFKEGQTYGYISAVSEEDAKKGKAAGDVLMYTYHGNEGGVHKLKSVDANGAVLGRYECSTPCIAIKAYFGNRLDRIAYNPGSMIGSAFQDAMNGHLDPVRVTASTASPFVLSGWAGNYEGIFEGDASGSVTIEDQREGLSVDIGVGHERCVGGVKFSAPQPSGDILVKRFPTDDSGNQCVLTLTRNGTRLAVEEDACSYYLGAECSFNGEASR